LHGGCTVAAGLGGGRPNLQSNFCGGCPTCVAFVGDRCILAMWARHKTPRSVGLMTLPWELLACFLSFFLSFSFFFFFFLFAFFLSFFFLSLFI
jgi:hypothetical protein